MKNRLAHTPKSQMALSGVIGAAAAAAVWFMVGQTVWNGPSRAETAQTMSTEEFNRRVREYLLENPEVIGEALQRLEQRELTAQQKVVETVLKTRADELLRDPESPVGGNPEGDVTLVEFFDYNCPYCRRVAPAMEKAISGDPKLRVVYKEFPILGEGSVVAAKAALASRKQDKYVAFHEALMRHKGQVNEKSVLKVAESVGLDEQRLKTDMEDEAITKAIGRNHELARALRINGTPGFVIGTRIIPGAVDLENLQAAIEEARKQKKP